jgi:hypothetical protein
MKWAVINVICKQWQLFEVQIYRKGNYLFNLQNRQKTQLKIILWNESGWCDKRGWNDQGTRWPGAKWPGDKRTGTKWPGTKWKGTNRRVTVFLTYMSKKGLKDTVLFSFTPFLSSPRPKNGYHPHPFTKNFSKIPTLHQPLKQLPRTLTIMYIIYYYITTLLHYYIRL